MHFEQILRNCDYFSIIFQNFQRFLISFVYFFYEFSKICDQFSMIFNEFQKYENTFEISKKRCLLWSRFTYFIHRYPFIQSAS